MQDGRRRIIGPDALSEGELIGLERNEYKFLKQLTVRYAGASKPVKGVQVSYLGDIRFLHEEEYRVVDVLPNHPIFHADDSDNTNSYTAILKQLGIPLIAPRLFIDED